MNTRTWAVTGAAGHLSPQVVETLLGRGAPLLAADDLSIGRREQRATHLEVPLLRLIEAAVGDPAAVAGLFLERRPAAVVHLATIPSRPPRPGSGCPRRDVGPGPDAARAVVSSLDVALPGLPTVDVAMGAAVSMQQVLDMVGEPRGQALSIATGPDEVGPVERSRIPADVGRLRALIGRALHADPDDVLAEEPIGSGGGPAR